MISSQSTGQGLYTSPKKRDTNHTWARVRAQKSCAAIEWQRILMKCLSKMLSEFVSEGSNNLVHTDTYMDKFVIYTWAIWVVLQIAYDAKYKFA